MTFKFVTLGLVISVQVAADGIATDGTTGAIQTLSGSNVSIPQNLGTTTGNNLFHSFADFNIDKGQTVTFTGNDNLQNVISRVTGDNKSIIDGTLKSEIKNADFYFINPNGITFNTNASVDVPAAFHVTTADSINFGKNGGVFYSDKSKQSQLSSESPTTLGFLGTSKVNNGLLEIDGSRLITQKNVLASNGEQSLDMVAGQISVKNNAIVSAMNGDVRLIAMQNKGFIDLEKTKDGTLYLPNLIPSKTNAGKIILSDSQVTTTADSQRIGIWGGNFSLKNTWIMSRNAGLVDSKIDENIEIHTNTLNASDNSSIWSDNIPNALGKAGNVFVTTTESVTLSNDSSIESDSYGWGDTGSVNVFSNQILLDSNAKILSSAQGDFTGNAGDVTVKALKLNMDNDASIYSISKGIGKTGNVAVESTGLLNMANGARISNNTLGLNDGGNVTVKAGEIKVDNNANIISMQAGDVIIDSEGALNVSNGAAIGQFVNYNVGNTITNHSNNRIGNVIVNAASIVLDGKGAKYTGIYSTTAQGGNVTVKSRSSLNIVNGATISISSDSGGDAGDITINAGSLKIDNQTNENGITGIESYNLKAGRTAGIKVETDGTIDILNGGIIYNSTLNESEAGDITVKAGDLKIEGGDNRKDFTGGIYSETFSSGKGGAVNVESLGNLSILHGGAIDTSAFTNSTGRAGELTITAKTLQIDGSGLLSNLPTPSGIYSRALYFSGGETGNVNVTATDSIHLSNFGHISIENYSSAIDTTKIIPSTIKVNSPNINMIMLSQITSASAENIAAGNIVVNFAHRLNMDNSFINTMTNTGDGGAINVNGGELISLKNSGFTTTVSGENGNGGDISVKAQMLIMDKGVIQGNAKSGNGGNIDLALQALIPSANQLIKGGESIDWDKLPSNVIQAASKTGVNGTVNNSAPQMNLSGVLANINSNNFDNRLVNQDYCAVGKGSSLSKKGKGGLPLRAKDLQVY